MSYVLIELDTGNTVGFFPTERAALDDVVDSIRRYGVDSIDTLGLAFNDPAGPVRRVAAGRELAQLATMRSENGQPTHENGKPARAASRSAKASSTAS